MKHWWSELSWGERLTVVGLAVLLSPIALYSLGCGLGLLSNFIHWASCSFACPFWAGTEWKQ